MTASLRLEGAFDFHAIAHLTPGFVGADLQALKNEAAIIAIRRIFAELSFNQPTASIMSINGGSSVTPMSVSGPLAVPTAAGSAAAAKSAPLSVQQQRQKHQAELDVRENISDRLKQLRQPLDEQTLSKIAITMHDFVQAVKKVQPSAKREGFATVPGVTWNDVGALDGIRKELALALIEPIKFPERFEHLGLNTPCGVLLYGPPGCGKTLLAKAVAVSNFL